MHLASSAGSSSVPGRRRAEKRRGNRHEGTGCDYHFTSTRFRTGFRHTKKDIHHLAGWGFYRRLRDGNRAGHRSVFSLGVFFTGLTLSRHGFFARARRGGGNAQWGLFLIRNGNVSWMCCLILGVYDESLVLARRGHVLVDNTGPEGSRCSPHPLTYSESCRTDLLFLPPREEVGNGRKKGHQRRRRRSNLIDFIR